MDDRHLYQQIADSIRKMILEGQVKTGDRLPSVRELCTLWQCTTGTVQRAYQVLSREGLVVSQAGRGTHVAGIEGAAITPSLSPLRTVSLVHRSETFLLEALTAGYDLQEIQTALDLAMDRWRVLQQIPAPAIRQRLRFAGSHDMALTGVARHVFGELLPDVNLQLTFTGSRAGLQALKAGKADLAGAHLWDAASDTYNRAAVQQALPGERVWLVTFAHRRLGLIVARENPLGIQSLQDLVRPELRFVNRQAGSGTRVWLDANLERLNIPPAQISGYRDERITHSDVARSIAEGSADVGLGLESAALAYGLDYIHLARERYHLVMLEETANQPAMQTLIHWLASSEGKRFIGRYQGYDATETGQVEIIKPAAGG